MQPMPGYLKGFETEYAENPRGANLKWFRSAGYGLFLHYGVYSILGQGEWVQFEKKIPVSEYEKLKNHFTAENFDPAAIVSFAKECGMRYINLTTRHHDSFCLWESRETGFHSGKSPAGRSLVGELARECEKQDMALFLYYSHGRDWRHPHAPNNEDWGGNARPKYDPPEPSYRYGAEHHLDLYLDFMKKQVTELIELAPQAAGIWLDGIAVPLSGDSSLFRLEELYHHIRMSSPHMLVSYKQGVLGTEDFFAPEHRLPAAGDSEAQRGKIGDGHAVEICTSMSSWGYRSDAKRKTREEAWAAIASARSSGCNLLMNTGPLSDGSLDPRDQEVLLSIGEQLRRDGPWGRDRQA